MKYALFFCFILFFMGCQTPSNPTPSTLKNEKAENFSLIEQHQTTYENGFQYGTALKEEIQGHIAAWEKAMRENVGIERDSIFAIVFEHTSFVDAIQQYTPDLLEEIKGIADGANTDFDLLLAFNLGEELYNFCHRNIESCSTLAKENPSENIIAYNQDLPPFLQGENRPVVLKHQGFYAFAVPGMIGISGVSKTLAVSCNSLPMLKMNVEGLPLSFIVRKLLSFDSVEAAELFLREIPHAIPQNIILASHEGLVGYEVSGNRIEEYAPASMETSFLYHTNFPIHNKDFKRADYQASYCPRFHFLDSIVRYQADSAMFSAERLKEVMAESRPKYRVLNEETYLRFVATFPKGKNQLPRILLGNPKRRNAEILLGF